MPSACFGSDFAMTSRQAAHFRRQAIIGPFIVDFASRKAKLVIELDGGQRDTQRAEDDVRTRRIVLAAIAFCIFGITMCLEISTGC